jgi:hypothetical protein
MNSGFSVHPRGSISKTLSKSSTRCPSNLDQSYHYNDEIMVTKYVGFASHQAAGSGKLLHDDNSTNRK